MDTYTNLKCGLCGGVIKSGMTQRIRITISTYSLFSKPVCSTCIKEILLELIGVTDNYLRFSLELIKFKQDFGLNSHCMWSQEQVDDFKVRLEKKKIMPEPSIRIFKNKEFKDVFLSKSGVALPSNNKEEKFIDTKTYDLFKDSKAEIPNKIKVRRFKVMGKGNCKYKKAKDLIISPLEIQEGDLIINISEMKNGES